MNQEVKYIERDYTAGLENLNCERTPEDTALVRELLARLDREDRLPYVVVPSAAEQFDLLVDACSQIAKEFSGKLKAAVDYTRHSAQIELECLYMDFDQGEFMETLAALTTAAQSIRFRPLTSGLLRVEITLPYFLPIKENHTSN